MDSETRYHTRWSNQFNIKKIKTNFGELVFDDKNDAISYCSVRPIGEWRPPEGVNEISTITISTYAFILADTTPEEVGCLYWLNKLEKIIFDSWLAQRKSFDELQKGEGCVTIKKPKWFCNIVKDFVTTNELNQNIKEKLNNIKPSNVFFFERTPWYILGFEEHDTLKKFVRFRKRLAFYIQQEPK